MDEIKVLDKPCILIHIRPKSSKKNKEGNAVEPLNRQSQQLSSALSSPCDFKSHFANSVDPDQTARFKKFTRIFSTRHKQTTFSDAGFLGI